MSHGAPEASKDKQKCEIWLLREGYENAGASGREVRRLAWASVSHAAGAMEEVEKMIGDSHV